MQNREAVVAGQFYPDCPSKLERDLKGYFKDIVPNVRYDDVAAIISPHAGYVYSGEVAANAFSVVNPIKNFDNIFILAPSHHVRYTGASIYNVGNYITPLGEIGVNMDIAQNLIEANTLFSFYKEAHQFEHSLEVQLPFIQYWFNTGIRIIPIVIGSCDNKQLKEMADALSPWFNSDNLFIISSDFSHFPDYEIAIEVDKKTAEAIVIGDVEGFDKVLAKNSSKPGVSTSACGKAPIKILMNLAAQKSGYEFKKVKYKNSGDSLMGDLDRVVGYWAMSLNRLTS